MQEKKLSLRVIAMCVSLLASKSFGKDDICIKKSGQMVCQEGDVNLVNTSGVLKTNKTNIKKRLMVKGQAVLNNTQINEMKVFGEAVLCDTTVNGRSEIYGHLSSQKSKFQQTITVRSNMMHASRSIFADIIVDSESIRPQIILSDQSIVNGNIIFKGKEGVVQLSRGSQVLGKIVNGKNI